MDELHAHGELPRLGVQGASLVYKLHAHGELSRLGALFCIAAMAGDTKRGRSSQEGRGWRKEGVTSATI